MQRRFMVMRGEKAAAAPANASIFFPPYCGKKKKTGKTGSGSHGRRLISAGYLRRTLMTAAGYSIVWLTLLLVQHLVAPMSPTILRPPTPLISFYSCLIKKIMSLPSLPCNFLFSLRCYHDSTARLLKSAAKNHLF